MIKVFELSRAMGRNEELPYNLLVSLRMTEKGSDSMVPVTCEVQGRFFEELIRALDFVWALWYSMKSDRSLDHLNVRRAFWRTSMK